jgi:hypothetical protein
LSSASKDSDEKDNGDTDSDTDTDAFELEAQTPVKNLLYTNAGDETIRKLKDCCEIEEILNLVSPEMTKEQTVQAILSLWDRLKDEDTVSKEDFPLKSMLKSYFFFPANLPVPGT